LAQALTPSPGSSAGVVSFPMVAKVARCSAVRRPLLVLGTAVALAVALLWALPPRGLAGAALMGSRLLVAGQNATRTGSMAKDLSRKAAALASALTRVQPLAPLALGPSPAWALAPQKPGRPGGLRSPEGGSLAGWLARWHATQRLQARRPGFGERAGRVAIKDVNSDKVAPALAESATRDALATFSPCRPWCGTARPVEFYAIIQGYDWALWYHLDPKDCDCSGEGEEETSSLRPLRAEWVRLKGPLEALPTEGFRRGVMEAGLLQHEHTTSIERELFDYRTVQAAVEAVGEAAAAAGVRLVMGLLEGKGMELHLDAHGLSLNYREGDGELRNHAVTHCWVEMNRFFGMATSPKSIAFFDGEEQFLHRS